jgi:beta-glucosidase
MLKPRSLLTVSAAVTLTAALKIASGQAGATPAQPKVEARDAPLLRIANLTFKDLNRNGSLDPYEDWRLPVEKRVADLLSRMTMEEKAGLMQITSYSANALADYINNRNIHYLILRDNLSARELAAHAGYTPSIVSRLVRVSDRHPADPGSRPLRTRDR